MADIDFSLYNKSAAEWALQNAGNTYGDITPKQREAIKRAVAKFVRTPGFTIGDAMKILSKYFDEERAELIATTEITRAYAYAAQIEGEEVAREFPDVPVVKTWYTNNDDQMCPICRSLNGKTVRIDQSFAEGVFLPPAHPGCRCWMDSTTRL